MSAAQKDATHTALTEALTTMRAAGHFRFVSLADAQGLMWGYSGELSSPDRLAAIPSLILRAFTDRQPLLRYFSDRGMRFEYRSDTLSYIQEGVEGVSESADFLLDVPGDRGARGSRATEEAREFVLLWRNEFLVLRHVALRDESWCLLGLGSNPVAGRTALQKGAATLAVLLEHLPREEAHRSGGRAPEAALHARMAAELEGFRGVAPQILLATVTSKDGFVVAGLDGAVDPDMVAPLIGHSFLAIQESTQNLCGDTECVMLQMDEGILLARELRDGLLFAALLAPTACTGLILTAFEKTAAGLQSALAPQAASADPHNNGVRAVVS